jgi:hypothetical protein
MEKTDFFPPEIKPVHIGRYESQIFDAGWIYDWFVWWDGARWRDSENGWALLDQNIEWRGLTMEQTT